MRSFVVYHCRMATRRTNAQIAIDTKRRRKVCTRCGKDRPFKMYYEQKQFPDGRASRCIPCFGAVVQETATRNARLKYRRGITEDEYNEKLEAQGGGCAICGREPDGVALAVDHDHKCCQGKRRNCPECVRGLLCQFCNNGLGMFGDDIKLLRAAIKYLKEYTNA